MNSTKTPGLEQRSTEYAVHSDGHVNLSTLTTNPKQAAYVAHALGGSAHVVARVIYAGPWLTVPAEEVTG